MKILDMTSRTYTREAVCAEGDTARGDGTTEHLAHSTVSETGLIDELTQVREGAGALP